MGGFIEQGFIKIRRDGRTVKTEDTRNGEFFGEDVYEVCEVVEVDGETINADFINARSVLPVVLRSDLGYMGNETEMVVLALVAIDGELWVADGEFVQKFC